MSTIKKHNEINEIIDFDLGNFFFNIIKWRIIIMNK